jgi:hypothetical protein
VFVFAHNKTLERRLFLPRTLCSGPGLWAIKKGSGEKEDA